MKKTPLFQNGLVNGKKAKLLSFYKIPFSWDLPEKKLSKFIVKKERDNSTTVLYNFSYLRKIYSVELPLDTCTKCALF